MDFKFSLRIMLVCALDWFHIDESMFTAISHCQGIKGLPLYLANGPSVSVKILFCGIIETSSTPFLVLNIPGPTENQQPISIAFSIDSLFL